MLRLPLLLASSTLLTLLALPASAQPAPPSLRALDALGRSLVAQKCTRPVEVKTSFVRSAGAADSVDELQSTDCRGLRIAVLRVRGGDGVRELPLALLLEEAHPALAGAVSIGATVADVRAALGTPAQQRGEHLVYPLDPARPLADTLTFEVQDGRVRALAWSWDAE